MGEGSEKHRSKLKGLLYVAAAGGLFYWARRSHVLMTAFGCEDRRIPGQMQCRFQFTQFRHVRDIPQTYFDTQIRLRGTVAAVSPDATLRVQHEPIVPIEHWFNTRVRPDASPACLNVKVAALNVAEVGHQHLNERVVGDRVWFEPIRRDNDQLFANITAKRPGRNRPVLYNLNRDLIQRGYARVLESGNAEHMNAVRTNAAYSRLVNQMQIVQRGSDSTVGNEVSESVITWPMHLRQVIQNSSVYQILVMAYSALYFTSLRLYHVGRLLAGRQQSNVNINSAGDVLHFIRLHLLGLKPSTNQPVDPKLYRSYNFDKMSSSGTVMPVLTARSIMDVVGKAVRTLAALLGIVLRGAYKVTKRGVSAGQKAVKQAQRQADKKK